MARNKQFCTLRVLSLALALLLLGALPAAADIVFQCPDGPDPANPKIAADGKPIVCKHLSSGDGFVTMADGKVLYTFGFNDVTGMPANQVMTAAQLSANFPAPTIVVNEGDHFYLNLSNVGFVNRPDLFDPHTVHWHGFPQTGSIFDGLPESAIAINVGATATYYYKVMEAGTYMYHCHAEATEHMQMGMLGNLYVRPQQDKLANGTILGTHTHQTGMRYAYNDGDGSTRYEVELMLQIGSMDPEFHDASITVQALPFALMKDKYPLFNGRGYPDTLVTGALPAPVENGGKASQLETSLITASVGQKILLRLSNLNVTRNYTVASPGIPMQVVGVHAKLLRGPTGKSLYYKTNSLSLASGETADVILDTTGLTAGTYFLHVTELNYLSNYNQDFGGMMTEIRLN